MLHTRPCEEGLDPRQETPNDRWLRVRQLQATLRARRPLEVRHVFLKQANISTKIRAARMTAEEDFRRDIGHARRQPLFHQRPEPLNELRLWLRRRRH